MSIPHPKYSEEALLTASGTEHCKSAECDPEPGGCTGQCDPELSTSPV